MSRKFIGLVTALSIVVTGLAAAPARAATDEDIARILTGIVVLGGIAAIGQTVAEANPEYPASDAVADVAFVEGIEDALGLGWSADDVLELYADDELDRARIPRYAYPENRLAPVESGEEA